jgi:hypothetical protein
LKLMDRPSQSIGRFRFHRSRQGQAKILKKSRSVRIHRWIEMRMTMILSQILKKLVGLLACPTTIC